MSAYGTTSHYAARALGAIILAAAEAVLIYFSLEKDNTIPLGSLNIDLSNKAIFGSSIGVSALFVLFGFIVILKG